MKYTADSWRLSRNENSDVKYTNASLVQDVSSLGKTHRQREMKILTVYDHLDKVCG